MQKVRRAQEYREEDCDAANSVDTLPEVKIVQDASLVPIKTTPVSNPFKENDKDCLSSNTFDRESGHRCINDHPLDAMYLSNNCRQLLLEFRAGIKDVHKEMKEIGKTLSYLRKDNEYDARKLKDMVKTVLDVVETRGFGRRPHRFQGGCNSNNAPVSFSSGNQQAATYPRFDINESSNVGQGYNRSALDYNTQ